MSPILGIIASQDYVRETNSFESIQTVTVGSSAVSTIDFTSIPGTYKHLQIRCTTLSSLNLYTVWARFNDDSGTNYSGHQIFGTGSGTGAGGDANITYVYPGVSSINTALYTAVTIIDILDYANTNKYKTVRALTGADGNGSGQVKLTSGSWRNTNAITKITIGNDGSNFNQYSSFALYGIKG